MKEDRARHEGESTAERIASLKNSMEELGKMARIGDQKFYADYQLKLEYVLAVTGKGDTWFVRDTPNYNILPSFTVTANPFNPSDGPRINHLVTIKGKNVPERGSEFGIWRFYDHGGFDKIMEIPTEDISLNDTLISAVADGKVLIIDKAAVDPANLPNNLSVIEEGVKRLSNRVNKYRQTHS